MYKQKILVGFFIGCVWAAVAIGDEQQRMTPEQFEASLKYQTGNITLPGGKARLVIPETFRYLDPADSKRVLEDAWGNPAGDDTLGMLFPSDAGPLSEDGWGVVITYRQDGHVSDSDADSIDYAAMLKEMQEAAVEENKLRQKQGFESINIVGWAEPPRYDKASRKLYWAKELKFGGNEKHTLNYNIRILGREGVLVLNAVAGMDQIGVIKERMKDVLAFTNFTSGNTYAEYNPSTDKVAVYGLAALVGGAVAAKTGLLAKLVALLIAGKKIIIAGVIGLGVVLKKLLGRKKDAGPKISA